MYLAYIFFLFATVLAIPTGRVEVVFPSVETSRSGVKTVKFRALGEDVELNLEPAGDILAKDFAFYNGNHEKQQSVDVESLRRRLYRDSANGAALVIDDDEQPPSIEGIVLSKFRITPHERREMTQHGWRAHWVDELTTDRNSYLSDNDILPDFQEEMVNFTRIDRDDQCIVVEFLSVTERKLTDYFKTNDRLTKKLTIQYLTAENMFKTMDLGIKFRLSGILAFTEETEPAFIKSSEILDGEYLDGTTILEDIKKYFCENSISSAENADIIMLFITRSMVIYKADGSFGALAAGRAYLGSVCNKCNKVGVAKYTFYKLAGTIALTHEIAHMLGVPHDGERAKYVKVRGSPGAESCSPEDGYIMTTTTKVKKQEFSKCSKDCAKHLLSTPRAFCVYEKCNSSRY